MKKRYFLTCLFALGVVMGGCNTTTQNNPYNDLVMFVETPPQKATGTNWNRFFEICDCFSFKEKITLTDNLRYGTVYYINNQNIPVDIHIEGEDINEIVSVPAQTGKGVVWQNKSPYGSPDQDYLLSITSDGTEPLSGYLTWAYSDGAFNIKEKSENPYCYITTVYQDFIMQKETVWQHSMTLTDKQSSGSAYYTNTQDAIATLTVKGNGTDQTIEVPPFTSRSINWDKVEAGNQEYIVTINCEEGHTLNGFLSLERFVVLRED